jgi:hypothetical protein
MSRLDTFYRELSKCIYNELFRKELDLHGIQWTYSSDTKTYNIPKSRHIKYGNITYDGVYNLANIRKSVNTIKSTKNIRSSDNYDYNFVFYTISRIIGLKYKYRVREPNYLYYVYRSEGEARYYFSNDSYFKYHKYSRKYRLYNGVPNYKYKSINYISIMLGEQPDYDSHTEYMRFRTSPYKIKSMYYFIKNPIAIIESYCGCGNILRILSRYNYDCLHKIYIMNNLASTYLCADIYEHIRIITLKLHYPGYFGLW